LAATIGRIDLHFRLKIDLRRHLFLDPIISVDGSVSCASCHDPDKGFADGLGRSVGFDGHVLPRSAPSLWNVAFLKSFFWDARADSLEQQMLGPLYDTHEMGNNPQNLLRSLNDIPLYRTLFQQAWLARFQQQDSRLELDQIYTAITAFQASLVSLSSRYGQYAHGYFYMPAQTVATRA
jgi:cytochrome c peroxidase